MKNKLRKGFPGMTLVEGEVVLTVTGRETTPFPKVDQSTHLKTANTIRRVRAWLHTNAVEEARATGDDYMLTILGPGDSKSLTPALVTLMQGYLFKD